MLVKTGRAGMADSSGAGSSPPAREPSRLPRDAQLVISLLHQMGIQDWEPRVINQLLEYTFREPCRPFSVLPLELLWLCKAACGAGLELVPRFRRLCERGGS